MSSSAAAATVVAVRKSGQGGSVDLGPMPKLHWVDVYDQSAPQAPRRIPVPKLFQRGQEHAGKLKFAKVQTWLSRGINNRVTSVHIGVLATPRNGPCWTLQPFTSETDESPFVDGALILVCCNGEKLLPDIASKLPVRESTREAVLRHLQRGGYGAMEVTGGLWKQARARVKATLAFSSPVRNNTSKDQQAERSASKGSNASKGSSSTHAGSDDEAANRKPRERRLGKKQVGDDSRGGHCQVNSEDFEEAERQRSIAVQIVPEETSSFRLDVNAFASFTKQISDRFVRQVSKTNTAGEHEQPGATPLSLPEEHPPEVYESPQVPPSHSSPTPAYGFFAACSSSPGVGQWCRGGRGGGAGGDDEGLDIQQVY